MKLAVTYENGEVFQHFGHCPGFAVYEIEDNKILNKELLSSGSSGHSALADLLDKKEVSLLICGGIGGGAKEALKAYGITCVSGISGSADNAVNEYLKGALKDNPEAGSCNHHQHGEGQTCSEHGCH